MNRKKLAAGFAALLVLIFAGCQDLTGPEGNRGAEGINAGEGPFSFSIGSSEFGPLTGRTAFSTALKESLDTLPESEGQSPDNPVSLDIRGLDLSQKDALAALYRALTRYVALDLSDCQGTTLAAIPRDIYTENRKNIVSLTLPESILSLEPDVSLPAAEASLGLTGLRILEMPGLRSIGDYAFQNCRFLKTVNLPELDSIGNYTFYDCTALESLRFPKLESIGNYAFAGCVSLRELNCPKLESLGDYAFCKAEYIASSYSYVYTGCTALETVNFPKLESVGNYAFFNCTGFDSLNFPELVFAGNMAFVGSNVRVVDFPKVLALGTSAFLRCTSLETANLPSLRSIGNTAFRNCPALTEITLGLTPPTVGTNIFQSPNSPNITIKRPSAISPLYTTWLSANSANLAGPTISFINS